MQNNITLLHKYGYSIFVAKLRIIFGIHKFFTKKLIIYVKKILKPSSIFATHFIQTSKTNLLYIINVIHTLYTTMAINNLDCHCYMNI